MSTGQRQDRLHIRVFVAECYWPGISRRALPAITARAQAATPPGGPVRHLTSFLFERDEVLFVAFCAYDEAEARRAAERAGLPVDRVSESVGLR